MAKNTELTEIKTKIVYKMHKSRHYNKRHTPIDNICKRMQKISCKNIRRGIKELNKEQIIIIKPTYHGADVSLNVKKKKEIDEYLKLYQSAFGQC